MSRFSRFLNDERGAVTVDWVVLTAGVVVMAISVMPLIQPAIVNLASYIGNTISQYNSYLQ